MDGTIVQLREALKRVQRWDAISVIDELRNLWEPSTVPSEGMTTHIQTADCLSGSGSSVVIKLLARETQIRIKVYVHIVTDRYL